MTNQQQPRALTKSKRKKANTALFKAVRDSDFQGVRAAVANGADVRVVSRGRTALERAMLEFPRFWNAHVVAHLMEAGEAIPPMRSDSDQRNFVRDLAMAGQTKALASVLDSCGAEEEWRRLVEVIRELLASRWSANNPYAAQLVAPLAFHCNRDVEERVGNSSTWLHVAVCGSSGLQPNDVIEQRSYARSNTFFLEYLLALEPNVDIRWFGFSPLHLAAHFGHDASFDALLHAGADVDLPDGNEVLLHSAYGRITPHQWARVEAVRLSKQLQSAMPMTLTTRRARM